MKITLIILGCVLVISSALSGLFIFKLTQQINELELNMENQFGEIDDRIELTRSRFDEMLNAYDDKYNLALVNQAESLSDYKASTDNIVSVIQSNITTTNTELVSIATRISKLKDNIIFSGDLYDTVKKSIVTISNGESLIGSGFLVEKTRSIVTAYHVVEEAKKGFVGISKPNLLVTFFNGQTQSAHVSVYSEELDIAVLDVGLPDVTLGETYHRLPGVTLANSSVVEPGDPVFVIGSPGDGEEYRMGLKGTITTGVISQINRCFTIEDEFRTNLFQIDAAVNFGNSGGPLFNSDGEVIGMVTARMSPLIGDGIGMAVTSNQIRKVENSMIPVDYSMEVPISHSVKYKYPWSGITINDLSPDTVMGCDNCATVGAEVTSVRGPAVYGGVQISDVITGINDVEIRNSDEFYCFLADYFNVGDTVTLKIRRGDEEVAINLVIEENL